MIFARVYEDFLSCEPDWWNQTVRAYLIALRLVEPAREIGGLVSSGVRVVAEDEDLLVVHLADQFGFGFGDFRLVLARFERRNHQQLNNREATTVSTNEQPTTAAESIAYLFALGQLRRSDVLFKDGIAVGHRQEIDIAEEDERREYLIQGNVTQDIVRIVFI